MKPIKIFLLFCLLFFNLFINFCDTPNQDKNSENKQDISVKIDQRNIAILAGTHTVFTANVRNSSKGVFWNVSSGVDSDKGNITDINSSSASYSAAKGDKLSALEVKVRVTAISVENSEKSDSVDIIIRNGFKPVININPYDGCGSDPRELISFKGKLYFTADDGIHGRQIWSFNGKKARRITDIIQINGTNGTDPEELIIYKNNLYFSAGFIANNGLICRSIYRYDGENLPQLVDI